MKIGTKARFIYDYEPYWSFGDTGVVEGHRGERILVRHSDGTLYASPPDYVAPLERPARRPLMGDAVFLTGPDLPSAKAVVIDDHKGQYFVVRVEEGDQANDVRWTYPADFEWLEPEVIKL